jgi:hypothetical protein
MPAQFLAAPRRSLSGQDGVRPGGPCRLTQAPSGAMLTCMELERARESLRAAALCLREGCTNAAAFVSAVEEVTSHGTTS